MTKRRWKFWPKKSVKLENCCQKTFSPREQSLVLWIVLHCGLEIPLEENKQSCEAVRLQKVDTKNLRTNFASQCLPWYQYIWYQHIWYQYMYQYTYLFNFASQYIYLYAGCSPVHASSAQEGDLPKTDPGSKSHKDDAVIGSTHHLVQRQNWTSESQKHNCSPGPLLRTRWTSPSRRRPSCRCSPRARRWSASTCTRSSGDRATFEEENAKKGRNVSWSGMAKELWPLWRALTTPELLDQHLASTTLLFCKPHSKRECKDYSSFLRLHLCSELPIQPLK